MPKPLIRYRTACQWAWRSDEPPDVSDAARENFYSEEEARGRELRECFVAADTGDGVMVGIADSIRTAADFKAELPFPAQGLPDFSDQRLRLRPFAERPLHLDTSWFARLPPQQAPPGFAPMHFTSIVRGWGRRRMCNALNSMADHGFDCCSEPPPYESLATIIFASPTACWSSAITRTLPSSTALVSATEVLHCRANPEALEAVGGAAESMKHPSKPWLVAFTQA